MSLPRMSHLSSCLLLSLFLAACDSKPPAPTDVVSAKGYDRACAGVADCMPVFEGVADCCAVGCPNTAISASALASYNEAVHGAQLVACGGQMVCRGFAGPPVCVGRVDCRNTACLFLEAPSDGAAE
jgi:hypothetical protein